MTQIHMLSLPDDNIRWWFEAVPPQDIYIDKFFTNTGSLVRESDCIYVPQASNIHSETSSHSYSTPIVTTRNFDEPMRS